MYTVVTIRLYSHFVYKLELSLIIQSDTKTAHHVVC